MSSTVIEVKYADPPKTGKKQGTVKTPGGEIYGVWPDKLGLLRPGRRYRVAFKERDHKGKTYRTITKVEPVEVNSDDAPLQPEHPHAVSPSSENDAVVQLVAAAVASQQVEFNPGALNKALKMVQAVYREYLRQSVA